VSKDWDLIREMLPRFALGDIEWSEYANGIIFRGPIKAIGPTEDGNRLNFTFEWLAYLARDRITKDPWDPAENTSISISKDFLLSATEGSNGQIDFATEKITGTFYPAGQNLAAPRVKEPTRRHLRRVK